MSEVSSLLLLNHFLTVPTLFGLVVGKHKCSLHSVETGRDFTISSSNGPFNFVGVHGYSGMPALEESCRLVMPIFCHIISTPEIWELSAVSPSMSVVKRRLVSICSVQLNFVFFRFFKLGLL